MSAGSDVDRRLDVTGKEIEYLYVCSRKLWLYHHGIRMELEDENVRIGMQIDSESHQRENKRVALGEIGVVDSVDLKNGIIKETKKSSATEDAARAQLRFYIWWMRSRGMEISEGVVSYPKRKQRKTLLWRPEMEEETLSDIEAVRRIAAFSDPPDIPKPVSFCKKCAYYDFCYS